MFKDRMSNIESRIPNLEPISGPASPVSPEPEDAQSIALIKTSEISNIEQKEFRAAEGKPWPNFGIRYSLVDVLRFKKSRVP
jgi:hypothetical protein